MGAVQKTKAGLIGTANRLQPTIGFRLIGGFAIALGLGICIGPGAAIAQSIPAHAEGLTEELVSVALDTNRQQAGVYSVRAGTSNHTRLAVLLPGYPSVVRPIVENGAMVRSKLNGNFLIRSRRFLADESIATLIVDCHSESGDYCSAAYQSSQDRQQHVQKLIDAVKGQYPSLNEVWLIGTSMGTISSAFMPIFAPRAYAGAIHTASITEPWAQGSYRELANFDYTRSGIPQVFVHHRDDPCGLTTYSGAKKISEKFGFPLITVLGGSGFQGGACQAQTEHGFKGIEPQTMRAIANTLKSGKAEKLESFTVSQQ
jgi:hypothetical protein